MFPWSLRIFHMFKRSLGGHTECIFCLLSSRWPRPSFFPAPQQIKQLFAPFLYSSSHTLLNPLNLLFHAPLVNLSCAYRQANPQLLVLLGLMSAASVKAAYMLGRQEPIPPPVLPEENSLLQPLLITALIFNVLQSNKCITSAFLW